MRNFPGILPTSLTLALLVLLPLGLAGQSTTSLHGNITDVSGAVVAQASVSLVQTSTGAAGGWGYRGLGTLDGKIPSAAAAKGKGPNRFKDPAAVLAAFRSAYPGESGTRNPLRGDGYFGIDTRLGKYFPITEQVRAQLRWETFNVTNSVRYDVGSIRRILDEPDSFGTYRQTLTDPRVMQFALRLEF